MGGKSRATQSPVCSPPLPKNPAVIVVGERVVAATRGGYRGCRQIGSETAAVSVQPFLSCFVVGLCIDACVTCSEFAAASFRQFNKYLCFKKLCLLRRWLRAEVAVVSDFGLRERILVMRLVYVFDESSNFCNPIVRTSEDNVLTPLQVIPF
ncbi:uncharacterized protein LOC130944664 isoform X2 [Arachis stenosperma]|uniref:uncharacterized protein LOC130944664 isoform X2 n=1 Tax=Arachis stenosperma TaxID=217475 RepID=UPI0025ABF524|nr:uncharacterized protein LOC130944664 isoform X2 [Arachis stenosperma]